MRPRAVAAYESRRWTIATGGPASMALGGSLTPMRGLYKLTFLAFFTRPLIAEYFRATSFYEVIKP